MLHAILNNNTVEYIYNIESDEEIRDLMSKNQLVVNVDDYEVPPAAGWVLQGVVIVPPITVAVVPEKVTPVFERLTSSFRYSSGKDWVTEVGAKVKNSTMASVMNTIIDNAVKTRIVFESKDKSYIIKDFIEKIMNKEIIIESDGREVTITVTKTKVSKTYSAQYFLLEGKL